ncbi:hypothetical protein A2159_01110, partial [Candidatus Woesebacteria bacterium RBG_13_34_9]
MKIAIDISQIVYETGVSVYTRNLVQNLLKNDRENEYILYGGSLRQFNSLKLITNRFLGKYTCKLYPIPPTLADIIWNKVHIFTIEKLIGNIDVFHSSDWTQPPSKALKITTIHDLIPLLFPKLSDPRIIKVHKKRLYWIINEVDWVIVPSQTTAMDAVKLGIDKHRIKVIPEAPDSIFKPELKEKIERIKKKYKIFGKYLLAVGVNPRKNYERIISAYEKIRAGLDLKMIFVGSNSFNIEQKRGVIFTGNIPYDELPSFYSGAEALIYPSLYEGFGLPILEAFSCKTPVLTSSYGSMKEIAGEYAVLVDPYSIDSISNGIVNILKNRDRYVNAGTKRIKDYS